MKKLNKNALIGIIAGAAVLITVIALVIADLLSGGKLYIKNNTDKNITSISITFLDTESDALVEYLYGGSVDAGEKITFRYDDEGPLDFAGMEATCIINVTFEGSEELVAWDGDFDSIFTGNIDLKFFQNKGKYYLDVLASKGLFKSVQANMNDRFVLDLENGEVDWDVE